MSHRHHAKEDNGKHPHIERRAAYRIFLLNPERFLRWEDPDVPDSLELAKLRFKRRG